jgi:hypothetical protein
VFRSFALLNLLPITRNIVLFMSAARSGDVMSQQAAMTPDDRLRENSEEKQPACTNFETAMACPICVSAGWAVRLDKQAANNASPTLGTDARQWRWNRKRRGREDFGGLYPAALECLANSGANLFAAADLTLMRSLRTKNAVLPRN